MNFDSTVSNAILPHAGLRIFYETVFLIGCVAMRGYSGKHTLYSCLVSMNIF